MKYTHKEILLFKWLLLIIDTQELSIGLGITLANDKTNNMNIIFVSILCFHLGILIPKRTKVYTNVNKLVEDLTKQNRIINNLYSEDKLEKYGSGIDEQGSGIDWINKHNKLIEESREINQGHEWSKHHREAYLDAGNAAYKDAGNYIKEDTRDQTYEH